MIALALAATAGLTLFGQQPAFDVASVRVSQIGKAGGEGSRRENIQVGADSVTMRNVSLRSAIRWSYHVFNFQINGPDWIASERFDIVAKAAAPASEDQLRLMGQTLLADRFKLALHRQSKEVGTYILTVGKNGPKFHESASEGESSIQPDQRRMSVAVQRTPLSQLVEILSNVLNAPVIDETGLKGKYDITIDVAKYMQEISRHREAGASDPLDPISMIMTGVQEELGLKLESRKSPVDLLIIDGAEKVPTEN